MMISLLPCGLKHKLFIWTAILASTQIKAYENIINFHVANVIEQFNAFHTYFREDFSSYDLKCPISIKY